MSSDVDWNEVKSQLRDRLDIKVNSAKRIIKVTLKGEMPEAFSIKDALSSGESLKLMIILMTGKDVDFTTEALPDGKGVELLFKDEKSLKTMQEFFHDLIHGDLLKGFVDKMTNMFEGLSGPNTTDS